MPTDEKREVRQAEPLAMYELVFPGDLNTHGTMFGGKVIALMDKCAGLCVGRWAKGTPVTASVDAIQFHSPIHQGQMVEVKAQVAFVGRTSCVVKVVVFACNLASDKRLFCCEGYFNMVRVDDQGRPVELPMIPVKGADQQREWERAAEVKRAMLGRRAESKPSIQL
jgi:acyl-CoA hydrolase